MEESKKPPIDPVEEILAKSTLSPHAKTFVPRSIVSENRAHYQEQQQQPVVNNAVADYDSNIDPESETFITDELTQIIELISSKPAEYDNMLPIIVDLLNNCTAEDPSTIMQCTVNDIVDQAIIDQNFRYNGVRMCVNLMDNLRIDSPAGNFREVLLQRCQREKSRINSLACSSDGGSYLRGLSLFIVELATRINDDNLTGTIPHLLTILAEHPMSENLKCACNILKLCGPQLEEYCKINGQETFMDEYFERLDKFVKNSSNSSAKNLIQLVINLRGNGWKAARPDPPSVPNPYCNYVYDPVAEAANFENAGYCGDAGYSYDGNGYYNVYNSYDFGNCNDGDNQEVCDAFDEFLRYSGQMN